MDDFKVKFQLVSHTPIIHYEKLKDIALRPTELKSKLDKFLIINSYVDNSRINNDNENRKYLKYKVKIKNIQKENSLCEYIRLNDRNIPFYFGNMGNNYHNGDKKLVFFKNITVEFFSFDKAILNAIKTHFEEFIAITNFGTRQNKGYGSFYIKDKEFNESYIKGYKIHLKNDTDYKKAMKQIELFYKFLRSGINLSSRPSNPFYTKPAIWKYFNEQNIVWEKKAIKRRCLNNELQQQIINHNNDDILTSNGDEKIVRDLLGLSTTQDWRSYRLKVTKDNPQIKRFKSPLMIKFIKNKGYDVYIWNENREDEKLSDFCAQSFNIQAGNCNFDLDVAEFNLDKFLEWLYKKRNNILDDLSENRSGYEYNSISSILKNIQRVG